MSAARLYALWLANGKPERIGYAATGGYVDAGVRWVATSATCCAGGAMGLRENAGRLYGNWCGAVADMVRSGWPIIAGAGSTTVWTNPFSVPLVARVWANTGYGGNSFRLSGFEFLRASRVPYGGGTTNADFTVSPGATITAVGGGYGVYGGIVFESIPSVFQQAVDAVAVVQISAVGATWLTANVWSRSGEWVRRKAWSDSQMMIRHEAGPGSARAVAVFKSSPVPAARAVRNAEFGVAEFLAQDWVQAYPSTGDMDLTDALIAVDAAQWSLWRSGSASISDVDPTVGPVDPLAPLTPVDLAGVVKVGIDSGTVRISADGLEIKDTVTNSWRLVEFVNGELSFTPV